MAMAACYPNYDLSSSAGIGHQQQQQPSLHHLSLPSRLTGGAPTMAQKDYSIPLHVDCSVEYELPNQAKPPVGARVEPLLMIHPCYFRKMESQRRSPFINNMPNSTRSSNSIVANVVDSSSMSRRSSKSSSQQQAQQQQQQQQQQHAVVTSHQSTMQRHQNLQQQIDEYVQRQMAQRSQQAHYPVGTSSQQQQQQQQSQHVQSQQHRHHSHQPQPQQQQQQLHQQQSHLSSQQQSTNQYSLQSQQQQQQQLVNTSDWSCYMAPDGVVRGYRKPNLANQTAYSNSNSSSSSIVSNSSKSKVIKRSNTGMPPQLAAAGSGGHQQHQQQHQQNLIAATCAAFSSGGSSLEGGLPSGPRWDIEKTSMAAVPRDFQAGPESLPIKANASLLAAAAISSQTAPMSSNNNNNNSYQPSATMYRNPSVVGKRDAMLSGGCAVYSNNSNNNNNLRNNNNGTELGGSGSGSGSLWDSTAALLEKSPMATIPRDYQAGPEHMACSKMSAVANGMLGATASGHSLMRSGATGNTSASSYHHNHHHHQSSSSAEKAALFAGKYRQHQRASHRLHPYMMTSSMGGSFPPLMGPAFPQMQQVSCYNV
ncbi:centrosomal and chromosomal factor-like [Armigeres subalbatus]|uniref:centrosomal and chromosomal factor-like n=1 Tax=Armigeres subalbatus TaxID=124917 RepID=UPI002ED118B8